MAGGVKEVAVLALLAAALYLGSRTSPAGVWPLLRRARWLFLSLVILYFWFPPGRAVLPYYGMPTVEDIEDGVFRIAALILLTLAVLCWLAKPPQYLQRRRRPLRGARGADVGDRHSRPVYIYPRTLKRRKVFPLAAHHGCCWYAFSNGRRPGRGDAGTGDCVAGEPSPATVSMALPPRAGLRD
ncbi:MAG TPA: hypothetical protein VN418_04275 [Gammaproteobacteria bacterium]|nr:hypothetical protein [Gammaproteobacteria bacterium]